jgi:hypothetical protein
MNRGARRHDFRSNQGVRRSQCREHWQRARRRDGEKSRQPFGLRPKSRLTASAASTGLSIRSSASSLSYTISARNAHSRHYVRDSKPMMASDPNSLPSHLASSRPSGRRCALCRAVSNLRRRRSGYLRCDWAGDLPLGNAGSSVQHSRGTPSSQSHARHDPRDYRIPDTLTALWVRGLRVACGLIFLRLPVRPRRRIPRSAIVESGGRSAGRGRARRYRGLAGECACLERLHRACRHQRCE